MLERFTGRLRRAVAPARGVTRSFDHSVFERFTERSHRAVALAREEAHRFAHNYVGTEHLLLGLLREGEGVAARALTSLGVDLEEARERARSIAGHGEEEEEEETGDALDRHRPLTPRLKEILELALRESQGLGHGWIGTEHLLLALSREPEGVASRVLFGLGVGQDEVRQEVMRALGVAREDGDGPRGAPDSP